MSTRLQRRVLGKLASYTIQYPADAPGTTFTNKGATGAITFTLPTPNRGLLGVYYRFKVLVAQNLFVASPVADTLVVLSDTAADTLVCNTIGGIIEAEVVEVSDGVFQWAASGLAVGHTYTVAT